MTRLLLTAAVFTAGLSARAENWPQWRGPKNDGHSAETNLPAELGPDKNLLWKLPLPGRGASTPCVWDDNIFLTAQDDAQVHLICAGTAGKEKWRRPMGPAGLYKQQDADNATASCSTDGKFVWAFAGSGKLACHDVAGNPVWEADLKKYGKGGRFNIQFGTHWTPVLFKDRLYLQVMHRNAQKLVALEAATGKEVWAVDRKGADKGESPDVYASPFVWDGPGGPLLVAHGNDYCTGHRLDDGGEVWRVEGLNPPGPQHNFWRFVACPLVTPDLIVVPSCKRGPTVGVNPVGAKGSIEPGSPAELWRIEYTPDVVSPLRVDDLVYLMSDGPLTAVEAKTGKQVYKKDLAKQIHRANMVYADGKIYVLGREGAVSVVKPGREFQLVAANKLPDRFTASPAVSNGRIYLRGYAHLWAFGAK